jgi:uncharacterized protein
MESIFLFFYDYFKKRKALFYGIFGALFLLLGWGTSQIKIEEDVSKFFPSDKKLKKINQVFQGSKFAEKLVVMVSLKDSTQEQPEKLIQFTDSLVANMQHELSPYIKNINYKVEDEVALKLFDLIGRYLPIFLTEKDFAALDSLTHPDAIKATLAHNYRQLVSPTGMALKKIIVKDPVGISNRVLKKLQGLQYNEEVELYDNYFLTKDHRYLLFFVSPTFPSNDTGNNSKFLGQFDQLIEKISDQEPAISATYFGAVAIAVGNANQIHSDTVLTVSLMIALMFIFLFGFLRKKSAPILILIPVLFGGLFSLTAIYFIQGTISVLAIAAGSIVLGIAINYSLHFLLHLKETGDVRHVVKDLATPMTLGSTTTVLAFLSLQFANASMLSDIGLFAGLSLVGAVLCSLLFLPHLVGDKFFASNAVNSGWRVRLLQPHHSRYLVPIIFMITPVMLYFASDVTFNSDMSKLSFMSPALKEAEATLNRITQSSVRSIFVVADGANLEEALKNSERVIPKMEELKQKGIVKKYASVSSFLLSDSLQQNRISKWNNYWTQEKKEVVMNVLKAESIKLKFTPIAYKNFDSLINRHYAIANRESFTMLRETFFDDYVTEKEGLTAVVTLASVASSQSESFYKAFEKEIHAEPFDKRMLVNLFVSNVQADFTFIVTFTSILVFLVLLISYGRIELTLITFIPMLITWIWILGAMALLGIEFNIVNVMISTFIFGLGDDYSIFVMDGLQKEYKTGEQTLTSIQDSIFLSALTTISGLGVLIFAQHPALKSIAAISIIGIVTVFVMSQTIEPYLFSKWISGRAKRRVAPITFFLFCTSILIYSFFILGTLLLTVIGFIFFKIIPIPNSKIRLAYHALLQFFMAVPIYMGVHSRKTIIHRQGQFKKPMVIISNHQSFVDILLAGMQHPKILLLTNKWVWNSRIFGWVVKMADYYSVDEGAEASIEKLRERVSEGYSIMIFPEGTRSEDGQIKRFHKGAFYLSEKLKMDILPLVLHGAGQCIRKGDLYINQSDLTMKFLPPIFFDDASYGDTYSEKAKNIGHYFKEEYQKLSHEIETPRYFRHQLISNYLYKGPVLEWYLRIKLRFENYYEPFHKLIPAQASVLDLGCGYGFLCYMLHFLSPSRKMVGVDYDEEKIAVANHGYLRGEKLSFACADVMQYQINKWDVIIISDVLHYLQEGQQTELLKKCFAALNPNGVLILRDGDSDLKEKHEATKLTEFFSIKLLGFNKSTQPLHFISGQRIRQLAEQEGMEMEAVNEQKRTSNVIFVIRRRE